STSRLVVDFGDLLSNAADVVRTRSAVLAAERTLSTLGRDGSGVGTGQRADEHQAKLAEANHALETARTEAAGALSKWSDRVARMSPMALRQGAQAAVAGSHSPSATSAPNPGPELEQAKTRFAALQAQLAEISKRDQESTAANDALRQERTRLAQENAKLTEEARASAVTVAAAKLSSTNTPAWEKERQSLQAGLKTRAEQIARLDGQIRDLQQALKAADEVAAQTRAFAAEKAELVARVQTLTAANEQVTSQRDRLRSDSTRLLQDNSTATESLAAVQKQAESSRLSANEQDAVAASVKELTDRLAASDQQLADAKLALSKADEETASATRAAAKSADESASAAVLANRVAELTATVANVNRDNEALKVQLAEIAILRTRSDRVPELERTLAAAQQQNGDLAKLSGQLEAMQRNLFSAKSDNARLAARLQSLEADRQNQITSLRQENSIVSTRLRQAQGTLDQIASAARVSSGISAVSPSPIPTPTASISPSGSSATARIHTVADGESLTRISVRYYGTGSRWTEIYAANRDVLRGQNALRIGQQLTVP
ncbi:MAG: LysM peptidoglycan-binding domain-containing protein, partial [Opitutus sp.]